MKAIEVVIYWVNKIWPWIVVPTLIVGAIVVGLLWGEAKKAVRS
jgi:ABC-type uncharacterized transport system permease subunit